MIKKENTYDVIVAGGGSAGLPVSILAGKLAADEIHKSIRKNKYNNTGEK